MYGTHEVLYPDALHYASLNPCKMVKINYMPCGVTQEVFTINNDDTKVFGLPLENKI
jgi:hypothetical protein